MFYLSASSTTIQFGSVLQQMPSKCLESPKDDTAPSNAHGVPAILAVMRTKCQILTIYAHRGYN